jgi:hypothetical protein
MFHKPVLPKISPKRHRDRIMRMSIKVEGALAQLVKRY